MYVPAAPGREHSIASLHRTQVRLLQMHRAVVDFQSALVAESLQALHALHSTFAGLLAATLECYKLHKHVIIVIRTSARRIIPSVSPCLFIASCGSATVPSVSYFVTGESWRETVLERPL